MGTHSNESVLFSARIDISSMDAGLMWAIFSPSQTTTQLPLHFQSIHMENNTNYIIIIIIISGFGIYGAAVVPDSGVGNTWQRLTLVLHEFPSNGLTPSRLHIVISFLTHADHVPINGQFWSSIYLLKLNC